MTTYFNQLKITIASYEGVKQPDKNPDGVFYKIYSVSCFDREKTNT